MAKKNFFYSQGNGVSEDLFGKVMALATEGIEKNFTPKKDSTLLVW